MPIFRLNQSPHFPDPGYAEANGLLAIGGDLRPERLLRAYSQGIFPWFSEGDPLLWWAPSPRLVLFPHEFHLPRRLRRTMKKLPLRYTRDKAFAIVIKECANIRLECDEGTWIGQEMEAAYLELHRLGFAHSVECWLGDTLAGGLYGVSLDRVFFGESMFSRVACGSQFALVALVHFLTEQRFEMIDCQMTTNHLLRFGAREVSADHFQQRLQQAIAHIRPQDFWKHDQEYQIAPL